MDLTMLTYGIKEVQLPHFDDERGCLSVIDAKDDFPFSVKRVFWITDVPAGAQRGGHAHWTCHEAVFALSGSFRLTVDNGRERFDFSLDNPHKGAVIPAGAWCELSDFAPGTVCLALASEEYEPSGYVHVKEQWSEQLYNI